MNGQSLEPRVRYSRANSKKKTRVSLVVMFVLTMALAILLRAFVVGTTYVVGQSMEPTLESGELVLVFKASYAFQQPKRYDIVVCRFEGMEQNYIKRVIGLPGERVEIRNGQVYIDSVLLADDPFGGETANVPPVDLVVPQNQYFLLGDNRGNSRDSADLGPLSRQQIGGKAKVILYPFGKIRAL